MPTLAELRGLWRRSKIERAGDMDDTTLVYWLQTAGDFIDLRQPQPSRNFSHAHSLADLSLEDCAWLARQEGFAGILRRDGDYFEWSRRIDFQPASGTPDAGSLHWQGSTLIEHGRFVSYVEHWHRLASSAAPADCPSDSSSSLVLRAPDSAVGGAYVRVGDYFMLARDRPTPLPGAATLSEHVAAAASVQEARALIDCEISFGTVQQEIHRITHSTLPFRVATDIEVSLEGTGLILREQTPDGIAKRIQWDIIEGNSAA